MRQILFVLVASLSFGVLFAQGKKANEFTVLVSEDAFAYGKKIKPLQKIDDVTKIDVKDGGFIALVDESGTTYESTENVYTLELNSSEAAPTAVPELDFIVGKQPYKTRNIVLYPRGDESQEFHCLEHSSMEIYWKDDKDLYGSYMIGAYSSTGSKIQDFRTTNHKFDIKPDRLGELDKFMFNVSYKNFDQEKTSSDLYRVALVHVDYEMKAADYALKAICLEELPDEALGVWQKVLSMSNGKYYADLYGNFLERNKDTLTQMGNDVAALMQH